MSVNCWLCIEPVEAVDAITFETGNNAELSVEVDLCPGHLEKFYADETEFENAYAEQILEIAYERQRGNL